MTCAPADDAVCTRPSGLARLMADQDRASGPAEIIGTLPKNGTESATARLASVRRRLMDPEPGSVMRLRHAQRAALHEILAKGH